MSASHCRDALLSGNRTPICGLYGIRAFLQSCSDVNDFMIVSCIGRSWTSRHHPLQRNEENPLHSELQIWCWPGGSEKSEEAASRGLKVAAGTGRVGLAILLFFLA